ncbi:MAG: DNA repair protein RecO [Bacteroidetes bacterium]|nr:DNA repair protein RecO [Bacteroidota bacterium]
MSIEKTEAVVLRAVNYRDSSKIVTLYTRRYGKMSAIAKGARNPKSKFGSLLQPLNYLQIVFYRRESRQLQYISSSEFVRYFKSLTSDMDRLSVAMALVEIVNRVMHDEEENEKIFQLLVDSLAVLDMPETSPENVFIHFGLHMAIELGFAPAFRSCLRCGNRIDLEKERRVCYVIEKGGPLCEKCAVSINIDFLLSGSALPILESLVRLSPAVAAKAKIEPALRNELRDFVFVYLKRHSGSLKELKSLQFMAASIPG